MKLPRRSWMSFSIVVLAIGVALAGYVVFRILTRPSLVNQSNTNQGNVNASAGPTCGNGRCENVACLSTDCPDPETATSCPEDCADQPDDGNQNTNSVTDNQNTNATQPGALNFSSIPQTLAEKNACPLEEANLSPSDAVGIAASAGLAQGTKAVSVSLVLADPPLEQCVWAVKNYLTATGGRVMLIVDATQDVYRTSGWSE